MEELRSLAKESRAWISMEKTGASISDISGRISVQTKPSTEQGTHQQVIQVSLGDDGEKRGCLLPFLFLPPAGRSPHRLDNQLSWVPTPVCWIRREHRQPAQITELSLQTPKAGCGEILPNI